MKTRLRKATLALTATLVALAISELAIRGLGLAPEIFGVPFGEYVTSSDPELLWEPRAGHGSVNQSGFRGAPVEVPKTRPRIILAGDSIAYGLGLEDNETIPVRLAQNLQSMGLDAEVLNLGVDGYNTQQEARRLELTLPGLQADYVVLLFCLNDFVPLDSIPEAVFRTATGKGAGKAIGMAYSPPGESPLHRFLLARFHLYRMLSSALNRKPPKVAGRQARIESRSIDSAVRENFGRIAALARVEGVEVAVAIMPKLLRTKEYPPRAVHERVSRMAQETGLAVLDLAEPVLSELHARDERLSLRGDSIHPNALGADLVARTIAAWLVGPPMRIQSKR